MNYFDQIEELKKIIKANPNNFVNYFNLGNLYRKTNQLDLAIKIYQKCINKNKNNFQAYNNIANLYKEKKDINKCIDNFKLAIKINPNYHNAIYNLGSIYLNIKDYRNSYIYFINALKIVPNHIPTLNNLAVVMINTKKYNEGLKYLNQIIKIDKKFAPAYTNIGNIYWYKDEVEKCIINYKKSVDLNPLNINSYRNLLGAYEKSNQLNDYNEFLKLCKKKFPDNPIIILHEGILNFRNKNYKKTIENLEKISFDPKDLFEIKRNSFLAKSYDFINLPDSAFNYFTKTNDLSENSYDAKNYDKKKYINEVLKRKNYFIKENIDKWKKINYSKSNLNPIFLIGFPRSGTTLLDTILRSHPKIKIIEEKPLVTTMISKIKNKNLKSLENITNDEINFLRQEYQKEFEKYENPENKDIVYIDKLPLNIIYCGEILRIFPDAKFILSLRHPLDSVLSCFMQDFVLNNAMANFLRIDDATKLYENIFNLWNQYKQLLNVKFVAVKYEKLIKNFEDNVKLVLNFLNLKWDDSLKDYRDTAKKRGKINTPSYHQVIQPIYMQADQRWKKYHKYLKESEGLLREKIENY